MKELRTNVLVRFSRRSGKIDTTIEGLGTGVLRLWALQNTTKTKDTIIFDKEEGDVLWYYTGTEDFPEIESEDLGNIEDYCPGMLLALNE